MNHFYISLRLSHWAKKHIAASRVIIILSHVLLTIIAIFLSYKLKELGVSLGSSVLWAMVSVYLIALFMYPSKNEKGTIYTRNQFYVRQKICDLMLISSTFMLLIQQGNQAFIFRNIPLLNTFSNNVQAAVPVRIVQSTYDSVENFKGNGIGKDLTHGTKKEIRKNLKSKLSSFINKNQKNEEENKLGWTILAVIGGIALLALIGILACNLSCSGAEGAAILVGIGGAGIVIFLFIKLMQNMYGNKKRQ